MSVVVAAIAGGTVGAIVAGAYLLGRHHGHRHAHVELPHGIVHSGLPDDDLAQIMHGQMRHVPVGHSMFVELERLDESTVRASAYRLPFGGEEE